MAGPGSRHAQNSYSIYGGEAGMRQMAASTKVPASVRRRRRRRVCVAFGVSVGDDVHQQWCRVVDGAVDVGVCQRSWEDVGICASGSSLTSALV